MLYAIVAVLVIIADQWIKLNVSKPGIVPIFPETTELIPGFLNLTNYRNDGAAFGFLSGSNATVWFIIIAGVFTVLVILALATRFINGPLARWSIVLVTAGGVSNCIDRVINFNPGGYVQDMFQFAFAKWFPIFNLADVFISVFCVVFILAILFGHDRKSEDEDLEFVEDEEEALEEEEEEQRPKRVSRKERKAAEKVALQEEEVEEEPVKPARSSRKARQARYDEEYEQYKAAQRARQEAQPPAPAATVENPSFDPSDPFAEWERANAAQQPAPKAEPVPPPAPAPRPEVDRSALAADPQFSSRPAPQPAPKPAARPKPAPQPVQEDFSLDDILAEFK
jgi:signal peptidase II